MDPFTQSRELLYFLAAHTGQEAVRCIREEMRQAAPGRIPTAWELRSYFQFPDRPMALTAWQQLPDAQYALGKLYLMGEGVPKDKDAAQYWFSVTERNGHAYAGYFLDRMERQEDLPPPNILLSATRLLHHMGNIFRDNAPRPAAPTGVQILQPEHIKTYLDAADKRGLLPMFYLELVSGLRKGELTALLWSDLDITDKTISVSKQYVKNPNGELTLSRPKTETSVRKVSIPQEAVDLLVAEHKKHPDNPYMFPSPVTGEMYYPDSIVNLHKKILKDAGLPHIRFHDLRHTFATLALQNGVDVKTVSSMLGHYDAGFTLRTYTHATRQKQDEAAQTMGSFMVHVM